VASLAGDGVVGGVVSALDRGRAYWSFTLYPAAGEGGRLLPAAASSSAGWWRRAGCGAVAV